MRKKKVLAHRRVEWSVWVSVDGKYEQIMESVTIRDAYTEARRRAIAGQRLILVPKYDIHFRRELSKTVVLHRRTN